MFIIKWRNRTRHWNFSVITGLSKYPTKELAERQASIWTSIFTNNSYYVETV